MPNLPARYFIDVDTNLALNTENQWSHSPYLGAVKLTTSPNFSCSIHIPQGVWLKVIHNNNQKWGNMSPALRNNNFGHIVVTGFEDPRQAAWFMQELLYSGNIDTAELIEDYLESQYCGGNGELWDNLLMSAPEFEGKPLNAEDEKTYFKRFTPEVRKKIEIQRKNTATYEANMKRKINRQLKEMKITLDIDYFGLEYFLTSYGAVTLKDFSKLNLTQEAI